MTSRKFSYIASATWKMLMMWPLTAAGTIDGVKWQRMPLLILRWIRQGVLNTALVLINFFFRTGFA